MQDAPRELLSARLNVSQIFVAIDIGRAAMGGTLERIA